MEFSADEDRKIKEAFLTGKHREEDIKILSALGVLDDDHYFMPNSWKTSI